MDLKEWLTNYLKWKDQVDRSLKEIKVEKSGIEAVYEDRKAKFLVIDKLTKEELTKAQGGTYKGICTKNSEDNFSFLVEHWNEFVRLSGLMLVFVNLELGEKWILFPATHNSIAEKETLEQGLRTMFEMANGKIAEAKPSKKPMFEQSDEEEADDEDE
jgi:hypothetical protein